MKGKDEESGLEKRQNREVGQRQATSVFCVRRDIPVHFCPKRWRRWTTAMLLMTKRAKQKSHFNSPCFLILHLLLPVQSQIFYLPRDNFIKSDTCQRICVKTSANCHVHGVGLDSPLCCQYLLASRCWGQRHVIASGQHTTWGSGRCLFSQRTTGI